MRYNKYCKIHLTIPKKRNFFFVRDPIHEAINFKESQIWLYELINTKEFQRLSKIQQLGLTHHNFPTATHTRLSHSLGTYELANKFIEHFLSTQQLTHKNQVEINIALAVALLHDLGHGPYSHSFELLFKFSHEKMTVKIIQCERLKINNLLKKKAVEDSLPENFYIDEICNVLLKKSKYTWIQEFISSDIDVDRLDYIIRDQFFASSNYGESNHNLLIKWSVLHGKNNNKKFLFLTKAKYLIFNFLISRQYMFLNIYTNQISLIYEELLIFITNLLLNNEALFKSKDIYKKVGFLFRDPNSWSAEEFLELNEDYFNYFLDVISECSHPILSSITNLYFGNIDKSEHQCIKMNEVENKKYQKFSKINLPTLENQILLKEVNRGETNINNEILFFNDATKKEELIRLSLAQEKNALTYIAIISKKRYLEWIKYIENE